MFRLLARKSARKLSPLRNGVAPDRSAFRDAVTLISIFLISQQSPEGLALRRPIGTKNSYML
jgi:hypothetical protein